ncbi:MAG: Na+/H+ antiporter NhaC [Sarcina sp.]
MEKKLPSKKAASFLLLSLILILAFGMINKVDIKILLLIGMGLTIIVTKFQGYEFKDILEQMKGGVVRAFPAMCIFILIGALIGSWIQAGVIQTLVYYGLNIISAKYFLPVGLIVCSITSIATGTSWGTAGTVGVAFMAMGEGLGIPAPLTAGMIVSGAFFGDKLSPLSDTTNLAAATAGANLYKHIKSMLATTVPSYIVSLIGFYVLGLKYSVDVAINNDMVNQINTTLTKDFHISIIMLIPVLVVLVLSVMKVDAILALGIGAFVGVIFAVIFQGSSIPDALNVLSTGYKSHTGVHAVDVLLTRGGIMSMMSTFALSFIALALGSILEKYGYLDVMINVILDKIKSLGSLVALTIGTCLLTNIIMGEVYLAIIVNGSIYKKEYEERGLDNSMLSRVIEEGGTLTGPLVPWTTAGAFVSGVLGVSTFAYLPYALLNIINPLMSILFTYLGIAIGRKKKENN